MAMRTWTNRRRLSNTLPELGGDDHLPNTPPLRSTPQQPLPSPADLEGHSRRPEAHGWIGSTLLKEQAMLAQDLIASSTGLRRS
jgi:hypothetical protein